MFTVAIESKGTVKKEINFYSACKAIVGVDGGIVISLYAPRGSITAFWDSFEKKVKPGFGATEMEREAIIDFRL